MRGILDLDDLCMTKIYEYLTPLDLCSVGQCCRQLRNHVHDHLHSLYYIRENCLDLTIARNIREFNKILQHCGIFARHLKISIFAEINVLLDVIANNCGESIKNLSLSSVRFNKIDTRKLENVFNNLETLELLYSSGKQQCFKKLLLGHAYPHLTTLKIVCSDIQTGVLERFFATERNIKTLNCGYISGHLLRLISLNSAELEELRFSAKEDKHLMFVAQLRKLKRLEFDCSICSQRSVIALIKELSLKNELELLCIYSDYHFTDEFCDAVSNLTNVKTLGLNGRFTLNGTKSIEMLGQKLFQLECFMLQHAVNFPYRNFLVSACNSEKFRAFHVYRSWPGIKDFIEEMVKDFVDRRGHRYLVSSEPLCIYIDNLASVLELVTQNNLQSIEKYGNIKINSPNCLCCSQRQCARWHHMFDLLPYVAELNSPLWS